MAANSGQEFEKYWAQSLKADSELLKGLSEHFAAVSQVEETDPRKPDAKTLQSAAKHCEAAQTHFEKSLTASQEMLRSIPSKGVKELEELIRFRLQGGIDNVKRLEKAVGSIHDSLKTGKYPSMASCLHWIEALDSIVARFRVNAQFHQAEGY